MNSLEGGELRHEPAEKVCGVLLLAGSLVTFQPAEAAQTRTSAVNAQETLC